MWSGNGCTAAQQAAWKYPYIEQNGNVSGQVYASGKLKKKTVFTCVLLNLQQMLNNKCIISDVHFNVAH